MDMKEHKTIMNKDSTNQDNIKTNIKKDMVVVIEEEEDTEVEEEVDINICQREKLDK